MKLVPPVLTECLDGVKKKKTSILAKGNQEWQDWTEGYPEKIQKALEKHGHLRGNKK